MAHEAVGSCIDDSMPLFASNRARPEPSKMDSSPPREQDTGEGQAREQIRSVIADVPDAPEAQRARGKVREHNDADGGDCAVGPYVPGGEALLSAVRPKRCRGPRDDPSDPGDSEQCPRAHETPRDQVQVNRYGNAESSSR